MIEKLRKSKCPKEISEVIGEVINRQAIFIIWKSRQGSNSFIKTGRILKKQGPDIQVEVHDYHSQNSFIEEESISYGDFIYFKSSFFNFTFKASFISNADDNSFWVKMPEESLLIEKRKYPRTALNSYNWKSAEFKVIKEKDFQDYQFPIPDTEDTFGPLVEEFQNSPTPENPDVKSDQLKSNTSNIGPDFENENQISLDQLNGAIIETSLKGAKLLTYQASNHLFLVNQILQFSYIEGLSIDLLPIEAEIKSVEAGKLSSHLPQENLKCVQIGLEFGQIVNF